MAAVIVKLECITNMHVGNGEVNYNIIDNEVERDPVTNYPTINASGVKGALREYFAIHKPELVDEAFGKDGKESTPGKLKVLGADMLYMPLRASLGKEPYYLVTTDEILERFALFNKTFLRKDVTYTSKEENGAAAEGISLKKYVMLDEKRFTSSGMMSFVIFHFRCLQETSLTMVEAQTSGMKRLCRMKAFSALLSSPITRSF